MPWGRCSPWGGGECSFGFLDFLGRLSSWMVGLLRRDPVQESLASWLSLESLCFALSSSRYASGTYYVSHVTLGSRDMMGKTGQSPVLPPAFQWGGQEAPGQEAGAWSCWFPWPREGGWASRWEVTGKLSGRGWRQRSQMTAAPRPTKPRGRALSSSLSRPVLSGASVSHTAIL